MTNQETIELRKIAHARSGDKGNHANVAVIAYTQAGYDYLESHLTEEIVQDFFRSLGCQTVRRYELPNVWAMNFMLHDALAGGASQSLRIDTQGKLLGTAILELQLLRPTEWQAMLKSTV